MRENKLRWFGHVEGKKNDNKVKKIDEMRVEGNWERVRPKRKWMEVIRENIRACGVDEYMIRDRER